MGSLGGLLLLMLMHRIHVIQTLQNPQNTLHVENCRMETPCQSTWLATVLHSVLTLCVQVPAPYMPATFTNTTEDRIVAGSTRAAGTLW
jgi:hypothetical protein